MVVRDLGDSVEAVRLNRMSDEITQSEDAFTAVIPKSDIKQRLPLGPTGFKLRLNQVVKLTITDHMIDQARAHWGAEAATKLSAGQTVEAVFHSAGFGGDNFMLLDPLITIHGKQYGRIWSMGRDSDLVDPMDRKLPSDSKHSTSKPSRTKPEKPTSANSGNDSPVTSDVLVEDISLVRLTKETMATYPQWILLDERKDRVAYKLKKNGNSPYFILTEDHYETQGETRSKLQVKMDGLFLLISDKLGHGIGLSAGHCYRAVRSAGES